jgi:FKBP-type peptidyl-prolyl cis-trans isomerase 2
MNTRKKAPQQKKKKQDRTKLLTQIAIVAILVICVVGFTLSTTFFSIFEKAKEGSSVETDFTFKSPDGTVVLTSDMTVAQMAYKSGNFAPIRYGAVDYMVVAEPYTFQVGEISDEMLVKVPVYLTDLNYAEEFGNFALFADEMVYLDGALVGLHTGDRTEVTIPGAESFMRTMTAEQYELMEGDYNSTAIGDWIAIGFTENPIVPMGNVTPEIAYRLAEVIEKADGNITLRYGYPEVDLTVLSMTV